MKVLRIFLAQTLCCLALTAYAEEKGNGTLPLNWNGYMTQTQPTVERSRLRLHFDEIAEEYSQDRDGECADVDQGAHFYEATGRFYMRGRNSFAAFNIYGICNDAAGDAIQILGDRIDANGKPTGDKLDFLGHFSMINGDRVISGTMAGRDLFLAEGCR